MTGKKDPKPHQRLCLEIGPKHTPRPAAEDETWHTLDCCPLKYRPTYRAYWGMDHPLPIEDGRYDFVYASHVLEHVPWYFVERALAEVYRVLKPGGAVEIWVPDLARVLKAWRAGRMGDGFARFNRERDPWKWMCGRLFSYGPTSPQVVLDKGSPADLLCNQNWHKSAFDRPTLDRLLRAAGFVGVRKARPSRFRPQPRSAMGMLAGKPSAETGADRQTPP